MRETLKSWEWPGYEARSIIYLVFRESFVEGLSVYISKRHTHCCQHVVQEEGVGGRESSEGSHLACAMNALAE